MATPAYVVRMAFVETLLREVDPNGRAWSIGVSHVADSGAGPLIRFSTRYGEPLPEPGTTFRVLMRQTAPGEERFDALLG